MSPHPAAARRRGDRGRPALLAALVLVGLLAATTLVPRTSAVFTGWTQAGATIGAGTWGGTTLAAWGEALYGATGNVLDSTDHRTTSTFVPVPSVQTWTDLAVETNNSCALAATGTAWCWGANASGQIGDGSTTIRYLTTPVSTGTYSSIAAGASHTCGVDLTGALRCWGENGNGQLGLGGASTVDQSTPQLVTGGWTDWTAVSAGDAHTCGIRGASGMLWCWGLNTNGRLGNGGTTQSTSPVQVTGTGWRSVSAGAAYTCATKTDDTLWCWGLNSSGQVGTGNATQLSPGQVAGSWSTVSAGGVHTCALTTVGAAWCWGTGTSGQLGNSGTSSSGTPVAVSGGATWTSVVAGISSTCGVRSTSTLWCWGLNTDGKLGLGDTTQRSSPVQVGSRTDWQQVSVGSAHVCARAAGEVLCAGDNSWFLGQSQQALLRPGYVARTASWTVASVGARTGCGLRADSSLWCWGWGSAVPNGAGGSAVTSYPTLVTGGATWTAVSAGPVGGCAIRTAGDLWCWGKSNAGEVGDGTTTERTSPVPIAAGATFSSVTSGDFHRCAVAAGGTWSGGAAPAGSLWCWGSQGNGELGQGSTGSNVLAPVRVGTGTDWTRVVAGVSTTCGLRGAGELWCFGANAKGQLGLGTTSTAQTTPVRVGTDTWQDVSLGGEHACGVRTDGTLACWGANASYQVGDGTITTRTSPTTLGALTTWRSVATGAAFSCATRTDRTVWCWGANAKGQLGLGDTTTRTTPTQVDATATRVASNGNTLAVVAYG